MATDIKIAVYTAITLHFLRRLVDKVLRPSTREVESWRMFDEAVDNWECEYGRDETPF